MSGSLSVVRELLMNPFTRFLAGRMADHPLLDFIIHWDALEALVIRVYKGQGATAADETEYHVLHTWLREHYPTWREHLQVYWPKALIGGRPADSDPFLALLAAGQASDFVGNWAAMQTLPAARETLNQLLMEMGRP
ncbi:MAG: hypothetical protein AB1791_06320 [Chloroflexota bacterium]